MIGRLLACSATVAATVGILSAAMPASAQHATGSAASPARPHVAHPHVAYVRAAATVIEHGFAAHARVQVVLVGVRTLGWIDADRHGAAVYRFVAPAGLTGRHELMFCGAPAPAHDRPASAGNVVVTVPVIRVWAFQTD